jgi:hypothetical protein
MEEKTAPKLYRVTVRGDMDGDSLSWLLKTLGDPSNDVGLNCRVSWEEVEHFEAVAV